MAIDVCVIAFADAKFAFIPCPPDESIPRMECQGQVLDGPNGLNKPYVVCIDPVTKKIVYNGYAYRVQET